MKKIISMLAMAVLAVTAMSSCIDDAEVTAYLTPAAKDQIAADDPDKAFAAAVAGIYSDVQSYVYADVKHNYFGHMSFGYLCSLMGNDMIMTGRYAMSLYHYLLDYWQENYDPTSNRWREYYRHVDSANKMIESIADDEENPEVLKYKAVALALRGFGYLHLSYLYGLPYYMGADDTVWGKGEKYDNANTPCVPIVTDEITGDQPRATVGAVSDLIVDDLETAYNMFKEFGMVKTANPGDIDGCVAAQYLARAYMIRHDWENAAKYAQVVIDNYAVLKGRDQICQGFSSINLPDVVWGCDITADNTGTYMSF